MYSRNATEKYSTHRVKYLESMMTTRNLIPLALAQSNIFITKPHGTKTRITSPFLIRGTTRSDISFAVNITRSWTNFLFCSMKHCFTSDSLRSSGIPFNKYFIYVIVLRIDNERGRHSFRKLIYGSIILTYSLTKSLFSGALKSLTTNKNAAIKATEQLLDPEISPLDSCAPSFKIKGCMPREENNNLASVVMSWDKSGWLRWENNSIVLKAAFLLGT